MPEESGTCNAAFERYAFNPRDGVCHPFIYGGCGGNANNFESVAECQAACVPDGAPDMTACTTNEECIVTTTGCCGACEPVDYYDFVAINSAYREELQKRTCDPGVVCGACPDYIGPPMRAWFGAKCEGGHCLVYDASVAARCSTSEDCHLRAGISCCENCSANGSEFAAISSEQTLRELACGDNAACDACVPSPPLGASAICGSDGLCGAVFEGR